MKQAAWEKRKAEIKGALSGLSDHDLEQRAKVAATREERFATYADRLPVATFFITAAAAGAFYWSGASGLLSLVGSLGLLVPGIGICFAALTASEQRAQEANLYIKEKEARAPKTAAAAPRPTPQPQAAPDFSAAVKKALETPVQAMPKAVLRRPVRPPAATSGA